MWRINVSKRMVHASKLFEIGTIPSLQVSFFKFAHSLPDANTMDMTVGMTVSHITKSLSNSVGLSKLLVWPSGGGPLGVAQRSIPGKIDAKPEAIGVPETHNLGEK